MPIKIGDMFATAIARSKGDQAGGFGIGERHSRLGDGIQPGDGRIALEHRCGLDGREVAASRQERGLGSSDAKHESGGEKRGELRQNDRGEFHALGNERLGASLGGSDTIDAAGSARLRIIAARSWKETGSPSRRTGPRAA